MDTPIDIESYTATRLALQAVAEHVLCAALHQATGHIGLRQTPGGFGTPPFASSAGSRQVRVAGSDLVVTDARGERRTALTTLGAAAAFAETEAGAPADVYAPATPLTVDAVLPIDAAGAQQVAEWYAWTGAALTRLTASVGAGVSGEAPVAQLWPEHFDLAVTIDEVNYGGSPGDDGHPRPYLYVGPFAPPTPDGGFWNEPFGASRSRGDVANEDAALAFFIDGRRRLAP